MTVTIALVGAGGIGTIHLGTLADIDAADVTAICDVSAEAATAAAEEFGADVYTDHEEMLSNEDLDALFVAIPPFAHTTQETAGAEAGLDLFVEKPIALSGETAARVDEAIAEAQVRSQVGHMYRYSPAVEEAVDRIGDRDVALIDGHWVGGVPPSGWWGVKEKSGGQVVEQAAHVFDLVRYFGGDVDSVCAQGGKSVVGDDIDFEDAVSASMKHESGAVSHVSTSCASPDEHVALRLVGDGFHLELEFWFEGEDHPVSLGRLTGTVDGEPIELEAEEDAWAREVRSFVETVGGGEGDLRSPYDDARKTFELTLAVNEALDEENAVELPLVSQ
ncbi:Gfo/Idh/MocA family protein [Salinigranum halophilum]|uniref:Gfo/Idh/MocA family protein n=1 Tax=Salinigranum halophilum TaxID=2565931 RepID=UPI00115D1782|nr:Gfo/Idh/MocA family oxidoreductase [Salinigranum halophilum]